MNRLEKGHMITEQKMPFIISGTGREKIRLKLYSWAKCQHECMA